MSDPENEPSEAHEPQSRFVHSIHSRADYDGRMKLATGLVCVDFYADWCEPCQMMSPKVEELAQANPLVLFLKVDVDEFEDIATENSITCMPSFVFFKNGQRLSIVTGTNENELKQAILEHLNLSSIPVIPIPEQEV